MDKNIFKKFSYGLYIASSKDKDTLAGCIINTAFQVTSLNPIISVSLNKDNYTNEIAKRSKKLAINILSNDVSKEIISKFGFSSSKDTNKFQDIPYELIKEVPIIKKGSLGYLIGDVINIVDVGSHDIFLIRINEGEVIEEKEPLTYKYYQENMKGISPKKAPTYVEASNDSPSSKYQCQICGYIYDDAEESVPFESLPSDWVCPLCGAPKEQFIKIN